MLLNPRSNVVQIRVQVLIFRLRLVLRVARRLDVGTADNGVRAMGRALLYDQRLHQLLQVFLVVALIIQLDSSRFSSIQTDSDGFISDSGRSQTQSDESRMLVNAT